MTERAIDDIAIANTPTIKESQTQVVVTATYGSRSAVLEFLLILSMMQQQEAHSVVSLCQQLLHLH